MMSTVISIIIGLIAAACLGSICAKNAIYFNAMEKNIIGNKYDLNQYYSKGYGSSYGQNRKKAEASEKLTGQIMGGILLCVIVGFCIYGMSK